jgi:hypothetical protein
MTFLRAIVMPTATGKSFLTRDFTNTVVVEADDVCMPRYTAELSSLRNEAKRTNDWTAYDRALARELRSRVDSETRIILVAAYDLALAMEIPVIAVLTLERSLWERNVQQRGVALQKYENCYNDALKHGAIVATSYAELKSLFEYHVNRVV